MLKDKSALITGSTSGIGFAIAEALAAQGCTIVLNGLGDAADIETRRTQLEKNHGVAVHYDGADVSDPTQIDAMIAGTADTVGDVDILVNCAGVQHTAVVEEFPASKWNHIIAVNLSAAFHTTRLVVPRMRNAGWGRIVNVASVHGLVASPAKAAYVSAKHGLVGLTRVVALETAGSGITCNAVCPGWTRTDLIEPQIQAHAAELGVDQEEGARSLVAEKQPSEQWVQPGDIGQLVVFLCSDAAAQMTGTALPIDGGWTAQ